jgi:hypothetical protein
LVLLTVTQLLEIKHVLAQEQEHLVEVERCDVASLFFRSADLRAPHSQRDALWSELAIIRDVSANLADKLDLRASGGGRMTAYSDNDC